MPLKAVDYSSKVKELLNQEEEKYKTVIESNGFSDLFGKYPFLAIFSISTSVTNFLIENQE